MREMRLTPCELGKGIIALGRQGESGATRVVIDCAAWLGEHPDAQVKLFLFTRGRGEDDPIVPALKKNGTDRIWLVGSEETKESGSAVIELVLIDSRSGTVKKSETGCVRIAPSPSAGMEDRPTQEPDMPDAPGDEPGEGGVNAQELFELLVSWGLLDPLCDGDGLILGDGDDTALIMEKTTKIDDSQIQAAVDKYLKEHPVSGGISEEELEQIKNDFVLKNQGVGNAGKLLYVREDGQLAPLTLGSGLEIRNGVLLVTGAVTPEPEEGMTFEDAGGGVVRLA